MISKKERRKFLVSFMGIESVINIAKEQAAHEASQDAASAMDVIEILAAELVALREWGMWTLSPEDVEIKAAEMGVELTADQVLDLRHRFKKGFDAAVENWPEILAEAIEEVTGS
jgi:hypothetical protein